MNNITEIKIENLEGNLYVSSRDIAKGLGKQHKDVLKAIDTLIKSNSEDVRREIIESTYTNSRGKEYREYLLTKDGFTLYMFNVQGFVDFKMAYIQKFNEMERALIRTQKSIETIRMESSNDFALKRIEDRKIQADMLEAQKKYIEKELVKIYKDIKDTADLKIRILENKTFDWEIKENTYDVSKEPMPKLFK